MIDSTFTEEDYTQKDEIEKKIARLRQDPDAETGYYFNPFEDGGKELFSDRSSKRSRMQQVFSGNMSALFDDPQMHNLYMKYAENVSDPEDYLKRTALAWYLSEVVFQRPKDRGVILNNLNRFLYRAYGKKIPDGRSAAFDEIYRYVQGQVGAAKPVPAPKRDDTFQEAPPTWYERAGNAALAAWGDGSKNLWSLAGKLAYGTVGAATWVATFGDAVKTVEMANAAQKAVSGVHNDASEIVRKNAHFGMQLPEDWATNSESFGDWVGNFGVAAANTIPGVVRDMMIIGVPYAGPAIVGSYYANEAYDEVNEDQATKDLPEWQKLGYASAIGTINAVGEKFTFGLLEGKISQKVFKDGIKKGVGQFLAHYGISAGMEGVSEATEQIAQNALDIAIGLRGKREDWTAKEYADELFKGLPESFIMGTMMGGPMSIPGYIQGREENRRHIFEEEEQQKEIEKRQREERRFEEQNRRLQWDIDTGNRIILAAEEKIRELQIKSDLGSSPAEGTVNLTGTAKTTGNLTDEESNLLSALRIAVDAKDPAAVARAFEKAGIQELQERFGIENGLTGKITVNGEEIEAGKRSAELYRMRRELQHDPEDTAAAVRRVLKEYPGVEVHIVSGSWDAVYLRSLGEQYAKVMYGRELDALTEAEKESLHHILNRRVPALWVDGKVLINADVARPSEVPFLFRHEVAIHDGIRRAFGDKARNALLDAVWKEVGDTDYMADILTRYGIRHQETDALGNPVFDESGDAIWTDLTEDQQREAAEEFLAGINETYGMTPLQILEDHRTEIEVWARENGRQISENVSDNITLVKDWVEATDFKQAQPSWLRRVISAIRVWLRQHNLFVDHLTDDDILHILSKSAQAELKGKRYKTDVSGIRHQIVGERGAARMQEAAAYLTGLDIARKMKEKGKTAESIKMATGWEFGGDGKWRLEIPDGDLRTDAFKDPEETIFTLDDILESPELYQAYPDLKDLPVNLVSYDQARGARGWYNSTDNEITLAVEPDFRKKLKDAEYAKMFRGTVLHEVQHAIQAREGFSGGGSPEYFKNNPHYEDGARWAAYKRARKALEELGVTEHEMTMLLAKDSSLEYTLEHDDATAKLLEKRFAVNEGVLGEKISAFIRAVNMLNDPEIQKYSKKSGDLLVKLAASDPEGKLLDLALEYLENDSRNEGLSVDDPEGDRLVERNDEILDQIDRTYNIGDTGNVLTLRKDLHWLAYEFRDSKIEAQQERVDDYTAYRRLAGEVESRNVQERAGMSMAERLNSLLSETEDVFEEDKIYLQKIIGNGMMMEAALRKADAPNNAEQKNKLIDKDVPCAAGFMTWAGLKGNRLYADYEFLYARHHKYFNDPECARAAVELVLSHPEKVKDLSGNLSFVGTDEDTGKIYRIEINPQVKNKYNHIRSVFEITKDNYDKIKLDNFPVLQPSPTEDKQSAGRTLSSYLRYDTPENNNIKYKSSKNLKKSDLDVEYLSAVERGDLETAQRLVNEAAEKNGYSTDSSWRMNHHAPNSRGVEDGSSARITDWRKLVPADYFDNPNDYTSSPEEKESFFAVKRMLDIYEQRKAEGMGKEKRVGLRVYRGVDKDANSKESMFRNGDWVTPSRNYAENESDGGRVIFRWVPLEDLYWDGNSIAELGYDDGENYTYRDTKNNRKLLDPVTYDDNGDVIPLSKRFNSRLDDVRYSVPGLLDEKTRELVGMLKPLIREEELLEMSEYQKRVKEAYGMTLPEDDLRLGVALARSEKNSDRLKAGIKRNWENAMEHFRSANPLFAWIQDFCGGWDDFKIRPSERFEGEDFTGTWISKEFRKYSEKRQQGKNENDKSYRKWLRTREEALRNAEGYHSDEVATAYANEHGLDALTVEQELIDLLRDLKKPDVLHLWKEFKEENFARTQAEKEEISRMLQDEERIENEELVMDILQNSRAVTEEWIFENRGAYKMLYSAVFKKETDGRLPGKKELALLNEAIVSGEGDMAAYARGIKEGRRLQSTEAMQKIAEFREKVLQDTHDKRALQREADEFLREHLSSEQRWRFSRRILSLMDLPLKNREAAFEKLKGEILAAKRIDLQNKALKKINLLLDRNKTRRNAKNVPMSLLGENQIIVDRIREIVRMSPETVALAHEYAVERMAHLAEEVERLSDADGEENGSATMQELQQFEHDIYLLDRFGGLQVKGYERAEAAASELQELIRGGKSAFAEKITERLKERQERRLKIRLEMTKGDATIPSASDVAEKKSSLFSETSEYFDNVSQALDYFSRTSSLIELDASEHGKLLTMVENAGQKEQTLIRKMQTALDTLLKDAGVDGLVKKGKFLKSLKEVRDTGIQKDVYDNVILDDHGNMKELRRGERTRRSRKMNLDHARKMLEDLDNGLKITGYYHADGGLEGYAALRGELKSMGIHTGRTFSIVLLTDGRGRLYTDNPDTGDVTSMTLTTLPESVKANISLDSEKCVFPISDLTRYAAREYVKEYDAGMHLTREGNDIDANALSEFYSDSGSVKIDLISEGAVKKRQEALRLSYGAAAQIILTAEQSDRYGKNMEWNGWTPEVVEQLKVWLEKENPAVLKLAYGLRDHLAQGHKELDAAVFDRYGVHLPDQKNFWYAKFEGMTERIQEAGFGNSMSGLTVNANFLTSRRFHLVPVDTNTDFIGLFIRKQLEQAHFMAWTRTLQELRGIYGSREVQRVLINEFGRDAWNRFRQSIEALADGGIFGTPNIRILSKVYETWIPANVAMNVSSFLKQIAGGSSYGLYVPQHKLIGGMSKIGSHEWRMWRTEAESSDYLQNRLEGGYDQNFNIFLNPFRRGGNVSPLKTAMTKKFLWLTTQGDRLSCMTWGYSAWRYFYEDYKKKHNGDADVDQKAKDYAWRMWARATDQTQQSGYLKDQNYFQMTQGVWRAFTAYLSNPAQTLAIEKNVLRKYLKDPNSENGKRVLRTLYVNHIVVPTLMNFITHALRYGINFGDYLENWDDYVMGWILGSFDGAWIFGKSLLQLYRGIKGETYGSSETSYLPQIDSLAMNIRRVMKDDVTEIEVEDALSAVGNALVLVDHPTTSFLGMVFSVAGRELRRGKRLFGGDDKRKKKKKKEPKPKKQEYWAPGVPKNN